MGSWERIWRQTKRDELVSMLVQWAYRVDLSNMYVMGYFLVGASMELSNRFGKVITREDVLNEICKLKAKLLNFLWFTSLNGVFYDEHSNTVSVSAEYYASFDKEPRLKRKYRLLGEPMYKDLKVIFFHGRADVSDWDWLRRSFREGEGLCIPVDESWPLSNADIAAGYGPRGPIFRQT